MRWLDGACVREDIENWLDEHEEECLHMDEDEIQEALMDSDSITGNMTGSYFCNSGKAKDCVMSDFATVAWAYEELSDGERFLHDAKNEAWETMDVIARCAIVPDACYDVLEERAQAYEDYSDEYEPDEDEEDEEDEDNE